ncbi:MAG: SIMPL domain-containing protein [Phycisphaerae bacterium]|nr:SIMPL domain-containing protein [Phycisphaerae bacterium]
MQKAVVVVALILVGTSYVYGEDLPAFPFICTAGQASIEVAPDVATISFSVVHSDSDSERGIKALQEKSRAIVTLMDGFSIAHDDAQAFAINKEEVREELEGFRRGKITGYEFSRRFTLTLKNLDIWQKLTRKLLETDSVTGVSTHFDVTSRKEKEQELMAVAIADARENAERMAKGAGVRVGAVYALSEADLTNLNSHFLRPSMTPEGSPTRGGSITRIATTGLEDADGVIDAIAKPPMIRLGASIRALFRIEWNGSL